MAHPLDSVPPGVRLHGGAPDRGPVVLTVDELARLEAEADEVRAAEQAARPAVPPAVAAVAAARRAAGLSRAEAAARAGVPVEAADRLEGGRLTDLTWGTLDRYAAAVGLSLTLTTSPAE